MAEGRGADGSVERAGPEAIFVGAHGTIVVRVPRSRLGAAGVRGGDDDDPGPAGGRGGPRRCRPGLAVDGNGWRAADPDGKRPRPSIREPRRMVENCNGPLPWDAARVQHDARRMQAENVRDYGSDHLGDPAGYLARAAPCPARIW